MMGELYSTGRGIIWIFCFMHTQTGNDSVPNDNSVVSCFFPGFGRNSAPLLHLQLEGLWPLKSKISHWSTMWRRVWVYFRLVQLEGVKRPRKFEWWGETAFVGILHRMRWVSGKEMKWNWVELRVRDNGRGELAVSYKWTGWAWEITGWRKFKTAGKLPIIFTAIYRYNTPI